MPAVPDVPAVELVADPVVPVDEADVLDLPDDIVALVSMNSLDPELVPAAVVALLLLDDPVDCCRQPVTVTLSLSARSVALLLVVGCWAATSVAQATTLIAIRLLDHTLLLM